jgi:hypothetical protein
MKPRELSRKELYELVWRTPSSRLAAELGITGVAIGKLCERHTIPRPPRGYWAKLKFGKAVARPALPRRNKDSAIRITPSVRLSAGDETLHEIKRLKQSSDAISVSPRLRDPCRLVREARNALTGVQPGHRGLLETPAGCLDVRVSRAQLPRTLRVADALLKEFASRGWRVKTRDESTTVQLGKSDEVSVAIWIEEATERVLIPAPEPPPPDLRPGAPYEFQHARFNAKTAAIKPTGRLSICVCERIHLPGHHQKNWRETDGRPIETRLKSVVVGLLQLRDSPETEIERLAQEERDALRMRKLRSAALEKTQREEKERKKLLSQARLWRQSNELRQFAEHVRGQGVAPRGMDLGAWLELASDVADELDPLIDDTRVGRDQ